MPINIKNLTKIFNHVKVINWCIKLVLLMSAKNRRIFTIASNNNFVRCWPANLFLYHPSLPRQHIWNNSSDFGQREGGRTGSTSSVLMIPSTRLQESQLTSQVFSDNFGRKIQNIFGDHWNWLQCQSGCFLCQVKWYWNCEARLGKQAFSIRQFSRR